MLQHLRRIRATEEIKPEKVKKPVGGGETIVVKEAVTKEETKPEEPGDEVPVVEGETIVVKEAVIEVEAEQEDN